MFGTPRLLSRANPALRAPRRLVRLAPETRDEFRGLLRKLLREASYLPDAPARSYFHGYIISSFRAYQPPQGSSNPGEQPVKRNWNATKVLRQPGKLDRLRIQAFRTLSLLERANLGHLEDVDQMLKIAYGRTGPLRQRLLLPYFVPDEPMDDAALRSSITTRASQNGAEEKKTSERPTNDLGLSSALIALSKAQVAHRHEIQGPDHIRFLRHHIPEENMWGRPLPLRRVRNLKRKIHSHLKLKILPPLPRAEWERLKRLSSGEEHWTGRTRQMPVSRTSETGSLNSRRLWKAPHQNKKQKLDHRFMQRRYRALFALTPCITWSPDYQKWRVDYGSANPPRVPFATSETLELFGIDATAASRSTTGTKKTVHTRHVIAG